MKEIVIVMVMVVMMMMVMKIVVWMKVTTKKYNILKMYCEFLDFLEWVLLSAHLERIREGF